MELCYVDIVSLTKEVVEMIRVVKPTAIESIRHAAISLRHEEMSDYDSLFDSIGDARFVLIGEASHGTHEFSHERANITKRLIEEKEFAVVAVEADFPDAYRVNRYVNGSDTDTDAVMALEGFQRFPAWMWRSADILDFVGWLRSHNDNLLDGAKRVGFHGLDLWGQKIA